MSYINEDSKHSKASWVFKRGRQVWMCGFDVDYVHLHTNMDKHYKKCKHHKQLRDMDNVKPQTSIGNLRWSKVCSEPFEDTLPQWKCSWMVR